MLNPEPSQPNPTPSPSAESAATPTADRPKRKAIALTIGIGALLALVGAGVLFAQSCPAGQQRQNGICTAAVASTQDAATPEVPQYSRFADVPNVPQAVVKYGGATTFAPLRSPVFIDKLVQPFPQFGLQYVDPKAGEEPGATSGIRMLIAGEIDFAQSTRPLRPEEIDQARMRGFTLEAIPVAKDAITFYVNPKLEIPGLTIAQLRDIYTGQVTNWQELGGPNIPIQPVSRDPKADGTADYLKRKVLDNQPFGASVQLVPEPSEAIRRVSKNLLGGIGFASDAIVCGQTAVQVALISDKPDSPVLSPCIGTQVNQAVITEGRYPLTRELYVIVKKDGGSVEQAGTAYANLLRSRQGQEYIGRFGFAPVLRLSQ